MFPEALAILTALAGIAVECTAIADPKAFGIDAESSGEYFGASSIQMGANMATAVAAAAEAAARYQNIVAMNATYDEWAHAIELSEKNVPLEARIADAKAGKYDRQELRENVVAKSSIILYTITAIDALSLMTGLGPPYAGDDFTGGSDHFTTLDGQLRTAFPDGGWQGLASQSYSGRNTEQRNRAQSMADLDSQLANAIKTQADCITYIRIILGIVVLLLLAAYCYEIWMRPFPPPGGIAAAESYAVKASALGFSAAVAALIAAVVVSAVTKAAVNDLASQYDDVASGASAAVTLAQAEVPAAMPSTALQTTATNFFGISVMPDVTSLTDFVRQPGGDSAMHGTHEKNSETTGLILTQAMSGWAQMSRPQPVNRVDQTAGQPPRTAAPAKQGPEAAAPDDQATPNEAALAGAAHTENRCSTEEHIRHSQQPQTPIC